MKIIKEVTHMMLEEFWNKHAQNKSIYRRNLCEVTEKYSKKYRYYDTINLFKSMTKEERKKLYKEFLNVLQTRITPII